MAECLDCGKELTSRVSAVAGEYAGESFTVKTQALVCPSCQFTTVDMQHLDEYYRLIADQYRKKHKRLTSEEIKVARQRMEMSQEAFASYLEVGIASIKRWELGQVQDKAMDNLIRLKTDYGYSQQNQLDVLIHHGGPSDEFSGWTRFNLVKFEQAVLCFVTKLTDILSKLKEKHIPLITNKLLWFADATHVLKHGASITGTRYARINYGPVPDNYVLLYRLLQQRQIVAYSNSKTLKALAKFDQTVFSSDELETLDTTWQRWKDHLNDIVEESHKERAWIETSQAQLISFNKVKSKS